MSAFEKIGSDRQLQDHWLRRLVAGIVDGIITWVVAWVILSFVAIPVLLLGGAAWFGVFPFLSGVLFFLYASFFESSRGSTIGMQIMHLKVTTMEGNVAGMNKSMLRNISKIHVLLWVIDTLIGMATVGDPRQKYSDRFAGTTVTFTIEKDLIIPTIVADVSPETPPIST